MGVRGLWKFIRENVFDGEGDGDSLGGSSTALKRLERGSTLLVDGSGWLYHLYNAEGEQEALQRGAGRSYGKLKARVEKWVREMRSAGMKLIFFWDGEKRPAFKAWTMQKRREDRELKDVDVLMRNLNLQSAPDVMMVNAITPVAMYVEVNEVEENAEQAQIESAEQLPLPFPMRNENVKQRQEQIQQVQREIDAQQPLPALAEMQVKATLRKLKVSQRVCRMEADFELAMEACGRDDAFIFANDSDFLLFKDVQYIHFGDLCMSKNRNINARVCTRKYLARHLGLSSEQLLVEFSLFIGNDYTKEFEKKSFMVKGTTTPPRQLEVGRVRAADYGEAFSDVVAALNEGEETACLWSTKESLQDALEFSRAYYNLHESLQEMEDEDFVENSEDDSDSDDDLLLLQADVSAGALITMRSAGGVGRYVLTQMKLAAEEGGSRNIYIEACRSMLDNGFEADKDAQKYVLAGWESQEFTRDYERMCRSILKEHPDLWAANEPRHLFHGPTFQREMSRHAPVGVSESDTSDSEDSLNAPSPHKPLPIDAHRDRILDSIDKNQITIIEGETGCGKSSRVPVFIMEHLGEYKCKVMVSQPRRIAAHSLFKRLKSTAGGENVALRMGHGTRDGPDDACITFATSGYMSLLAAHKPHVLAKCSHIIIDEIHERSLDADMLVYYMRSIVEQYPKLKLILMSATLCEGTYARYFNVTNPALFVGVKRFPLKEIFLGDIAERKADMRAMPKPISRAAGALMKYTSSVDCDPSAKCCEAQIRLLCSLVRLIGTPRKSILVFVPGLKTIEDICANFEPEDDAPAKDSRFTIVVIHSDVPFEEQLAAFDDNVDDKKCRLILATNAAESSITLPNVDDVICLGLAKRMEYSDRKKSSVLLKSWISKASAAQRAGRTARVRPGTVWRMYTRNLFQSMEPYEPPEMKQVPLDHLLLRLKSSLGGTSVVEVLQKSLDPPELSRVDDAFSSLYGKGFITAPQDEDSELTSSGSIAASLGIDLNIAYFVCIGIRMGCGMECLAIAAAISQARLPFRVASHFVHDEQELIDIVPRIILAQHRFDNGLASVPMMLLRLALQWRKVKRAGPSAVQNFIYKNGLVKRRLYQMDSSMKFLCGRLEDTCRRAGLDISFLGGKIRDPAKDEMLANRLRLCLFWSFEDTLACLKASSVDKTHSLILKLKLENKNQSFPAECTQRMLKGAGEHAVEISATQHYRIRFEMGDEDVDFEEWHSDNADYFQDVCRDLAEKHNIHIFCQKLGTKKNAERIVWVRREEVEQNAILCDLFGEPIDDVRHGFIRYRGPLKTKRSDKMLTELIALCDSSLVFRYQRVGCVGEIIIKGNSAVSKKHVHRALYARDVYITEKVKNAGTVLRLSCKAEAEFSLPESDKSVVLTPVGCRIVYALQQHSKHYTCHLPNSNNSGTSDSHAVVGSKEWLEKEGKEGNTPHDSDIVSFKVRHPVAVSTYGEKVLLGKSDLVAYTAYHSVGSSEETKSRYIACSKLLVGQKFIPVLDILTLLPCSDEWKQRAYRCMGTDEVRFTFDDSECDDYDDYSSTEPDESAPAAQICHRITSATGSAFMGALDIKENVRLVDNYFSDHMMQRKNNPQVAVAKESVEIAKVMTPAVLLTQGNEKDAKASEKKKKKKKEKKKKERQEKEVQVEKSTAIPHKNNKQDEEERILKKEHENYQEILRSRSLCKYIAESENGRDFLQGVSPDLKLAMLYSVYIYKHAAGIKGKYMEMLLKAGDAVWWELKGKSKGFLKKRKNELQQANSMFGSVFNDNASNVFRKEYLNVMQQKIRSALLAKKERKNKPLTKGQQKRIAQKVVLVLQEHAKENPANSKMSYEELDKAVFEATGHHMPSNYWNFCQHMGVQRDKTKKQFWLKQQ